VTLLFALLALFFPASAPRAGPQRIALAADTESQWVPFALTRGNQIRFVMTLNGRPANAVLDTGVSDTVVSRAFAARAGLRASTAARADAIGGAVDIHWAKTDTLQIGGLTRRGDRVALTDLDPIAIGGGASLDILVGSDILSCCALDIDYDAGRFRLLPSGRMPFRGVTAPLSLPSGLRTLTSEIRVNGRLLRPLIVDTGDGSTLTLSRAAFARTGLHPRAITSTIAFGLGGEVESEVAILPQVSVGALNARNIEMRIEDGEGFSTRTGTEGRIGSGLLQRYRVLLDPHAGRMVFAPGAKADTMPQRSTSGLLLGYAGDRFKVLHVMRNSPAAAAGWKSGEQICTVDGAAVPSDAQKDITASWTAGPAGRTVRIGMCDGSERRLTLRDFY
jgi:predicted aspartyl protease